MTTSSPIEFVFGGPFYRLQVWLGLDPRAPSVFTRIAWAIGLTWLPLLALSLLQRRALGPTPRESFLLDLTAHGRFLLCIPLLIVAEGQIAPRLAIAASVFRDADLVKEPDRKAFDRAAERVGVGRESAWAEGILLLLALVIAWTADLEKWQPVAGLTWRRVPSSDGPQLSLAGIWFHAVSLWVYQFLWLRWLWRIFLWTRFLRAMSRLDLDLVATHADGAGGLGFVGGTQAAFGILACAFGCLYFGSVGDRMMFEHVRIEAFQAELLVYLILCLLLFASSPLVFTPKLVLLRRRGTRLYGRIIDYYNRAFEQKWALGPRPDVEAFLGSSDIQSLADLGNSFDRVRAMRTTLVPRRTVTHIIAFALLPSLPLVFVVFKVGDILKFLARAIF